MLNQILFLIALYVFVGGMLAIAYHAANHRRKHR